MFLWVLGFFLRDFTCLDTLAISHLHQASIAACSRRWCRGPQMSEMHSVVWSVLFCSTCSGDIRGLGEEAVTFFRDIGPSPHCCRQRLLASRDPLFLFQRLSIAIQRENAASVVGTASSDRCLDDVFYLWCFNALFYYLTSFVNNNNNKSFIRESWWWSYCVGETVSFTQYNFVCIFVDILYVYYCIYGLFLLL